MIETHEQTVGEIVTADFRTAGVFERFGIDFCCGGQRSLSTACAAASADPNAVLQALESLPASTDASDEDPRTWTLTRLIDHILSTHHEYVRYSVPLISRYLGKLVDVHGARHPELVKISATFDRMKDGLLQHMMKEEFVLFPYIREIDLAAGGAAASPFGSVENPIRMMEREHREAGDDMKDIRALTNGYQPPADGCTTYRVCMATLEEFERDLHRHVHLENNVLFPKAVERERN